jgi:hypothetical protein
MRVRKRSGMKTLRRSVLLAMGLFALVAALWAAIGYRYGHEHPWTNAAKFGGVALAIGWALVAIAVGIKYSRLVARRRRIDAVDDRP